MATALRFCEDAAQWYEEDPMDVSNRDGGGVDDAQDDEMTTYTHTEPAMCKTPHGCSPMFRKCFCQPACTGCPVLAHKQRSALMLPRQTFLASREKTGLRPIRKEHCSGARHIKWTRNTVDPQRCKTEQENRARHALHMSCYFVRTGCRRNGRNNVRILPQYSIST